MRTSASTIFDDADMFGDTHTSVMTVPRPKKIASAPKGKDPIAVFFEENRADLLEAMYLSEISKPPSLGTLKYRMLAPDFLNQAVCEFFNQEVLKITEHEGKPFDWELTGSKVSVKSMHAPIFPRDKKNGCGRTKGQPIQLKNTKESVELRADEFDYLLVTVANVSKSQYGMYVFDFQQVKDLLATSHEFNESLNEHGYDGKGQIKMYVDSKEDCLVYLEMDSETLKRLEAKYKTDTSSAKRNSRFLTGINKVIKDQITMSRGKND